MVPREFLGQVLLYSPIAQLVERATVNTCSFAAFSRNVEVKIG